MRRVKMIKLVFTAAAVLLAASPFTPTSQAEAAGRLTREEISGHLSSAEEAFRKGMELDRSDPAAAADYYRTAILHFERITGEGGVRNGKLYYNTGNAWFRLGDIGRAILNYKRALLYMPNDPNLRQNLEFARSRCASRIEGQEREKVFKTLFFLHYDLPAGVRFLVLAVSFTLAWLTGAVMLFFRRGWLKIVLAVLCVTSAVFLASLTVETVGSSRRPAGVITTGEVVARKGDAETYQPSFTEPLASGVEFTLLEKRPDWWYIELESGARCWVPSSSGELVVD